MSSNFVTCIGAVVTDANSLLAVRQAKGHPLEGQWTIPWGRLEPGESPASAALREVKEESGIVAAVTVRVVNDSGIKRRAFYCFASLVKSV